MSNVLVVTAAILFFFFNDTATTEIYPLSLHDALPICRSRPAGPDQRQRGGRPGQGPGRGGTGHRAHCPGLPLHGHGADHALLRDRKSTRLNSSHQIISYAVFCFKKKKKSILNNVLQTSCAS